MFCCGKKKKKIVKTIQGNKSTHTKNNKKNMIKLKRTEKKGIKNYGNTCYINSVLHSLYSFQVIRSLLIDSMNIKYFPLSKNLKIILQNLENSKQKDSSQQNIMFIKKVNHNQIWQK